MDRHFGMRRALARAAAAAAGAALLWASAPGIGPSGRGAPAAHAAGQRWTAYAALVGTWLGPGLGDAGHCGAEYGQFTFFADREYAYTANSRDCAGFTVAGYYGIRNGLVSFHWTRCSFPCAPGTASSRFAFIGANAFRLADQGGSYTYYRQ